MSGAGDVLSKQVGPLPMGVWLLVGVGGLGIAFWQRRQGDEPELVTDVREVPVPVGAIGAPDEAPLVISPVIRLPDIYNDIVNNLPATPAPIVNVNVPAPAPAAPAPPRVTTPTTPAAPRPAAQRTHTVRSGDTLSALALRYYGDWRKWTTIYRANAAKIDGVARSRGKATGGHWIFPGTVLVIP